jgi:SRSO17 transposase
MTITELDNWADDFEKFHARFGHLFARSETREQSKKYVRGLMATIERKNSWNIAEAVGDKIPDPTQRLLYRSIWDDADMRDLLQDFIIEKFGDEEGIGVVDETGFIKKGDKSAGVQRQYSGTAGKTENCQIGTFLSYASGDVHVFLDRRLYLPESWSKDQQRRTQAKIPDDVEFKTKPEQAIEMLEHAFVKGVPMKWVTGDEVYGDSTHLRDTVIEHTRFYVLAVRCDELVWITRPEVEAPKKGSRGRPRKKPRLAAGSMPSQDVASVISEVSQDKWERFAVIEGTKGPYTYDWFAMRIVENRSGLPGPDSWLLARRSIDSGDISYYLSNAPADTPLTTLARIASTRYTVEQCIEEAKGEAGLDEYEVRQWHSWHRHITLSMLAHTWLASIRYQASKKGGH